MDGTPIDSSPVRVTVLGKKGRFDSKTSFDTNSLHPSESNSTSSPMTSAEGHSSGHSFTRSPTKSVDATLQTVTLWHDEKCYLWLSANRLLSLSPSITKVGREKDGWRGDWETPDSIRSSHQQVINNKNKTWSLSLSILNGDPIIPHFVSSFWTNNSELFTFFIKKFMWCDVLKRKKELDRFKLLQD